MSRALATPRGKRSRHVERALVSAFLEKVPDYVYFKDRQSAYIAVSKSLVAFLGQNSAAEILGKSDVNFFVTELAQQALDDEQRILRTGQPLLGKLEHKTCLNGKEAWVLTNKLPLKDEKGAIIGTFGL